MDNNYLKQMVRMRESMLAGEGEYTWQDVVQFREDCGLPSICKDNVRKGFLFSDELMENGWIKEPITCNGTTSYRETSEINANGTLSSDKLVDGEIYEIDNPEDLLNAHGFNPINFELVSAKNSKWQQGSKENGVKTLYASKIVVRPTSTKVDWEEVSAFFEQKDFSIGREYIVRPVSYDPEGEVLEIDLADLHMGLYAYGKENGGNDYDVHIAKEYFLKSFGDILTRCQGKKFSKIIFVTMGDILHVNNGENTTAKGTRQDVDTRITKIFTECLEMLIDAVECLEKIAPVEIVYIAGNHDRDVGFMLVKALEKAFRKDGCVTFNNSPNPRKAERIGNCLIGWCHGEMRKENILEWLQSEHREDFGKCKFCEVHAGHLHMQEVFEKSGMILRRVSSLCPASYWEHTQGYNKSIKQIISFVWNKEIGLRDMWFSAV